jgi:hypothetical protein
MKRIITILSLILLSSGYFTVNSYAQASSPTLQLAGGNVLNGTLTGTMLGAATMAINNDEDITPLRIGIGAGILGGFGVALYDIVTLPSGQEFYISGVFNDGRNSSIIVLLDTFYGAAGGAILGSAVTLISNEPVIEGIRLGSGIGAWAGFGFGLFDSFVLAERNRDFMTSSLVNRSSLLEMESGSGSLHVGLVSPAFQNSFVIKPNALQLQTNPVLNLISLKKTF